MKLITNIQLLVLLLFIASCSQKADQENTQEDSSVSTPATENKFGGLTLYTLRKPMKENPKETLKEVSTIGYKHVEAAGYKDGKFYGMEPTAFKAYVDGLGMELVSSHHGGINLENADQTIADVKAAGFKYLVVPIPPMGYIKYFTDKDTSLSSDTLTKVTEILNTIGEKCKSAGIEMLYHNHAFEFKENADGIVPMDYFLENISPEVGNFQLDLYWVTKAGSDPLAYFEKYPGRFKIWHVKDMDEEGKFAPVGTGTIDFGKILAKKEQSGLDYYIVEQDNTFDLDPIEAVKISFEGLKKFGFN